MPGAHPVPGAAQHAALPAAAAGLAAALLGDAAGDDGATALHGGALGQVPHAVPDALQERPASAAPGRDALLV